MSVSYSAYQPSGQLGSKLEHVIITFQKNEIPLFGRAVEVVGWQSIFIVILCTLKQIFDQLTPIYWAVTFQRDCLFRYFDELLCQPSLNHTKLKRELTIRENHPSCNFSSDFCDSTICMRFSSSLWKQTDVSLVLNFLLISLIKPIFAANSRDLSFVDFETLDTSILPQDRSLFLFT